MEYPPLGRFAFRDMKQTVAVDVIKAVTWKQTTAAAKKQIPHHSIKLFDKFAHSEGPGFPSQRTSAERCVEVASSRPLTQLLAAKKLTT